MKNFLNTYKQQHGGAPWSVLRNFMRDAQTSDFIKKIAETFTTRIALIGISLVTSVITARTLGPTGRGLYAVAMAVVTTGMQFGNIGLHASNTYYVAKDRTLLPQLVGNTFFVGFVFSGVCAVVWVFFFIWPNLAPVHGSLLILALSWIPCGLLYMLLQNILLGIHEVRAYNKIELVTQIISIVLIGMIILFGLITVETVVLMGFVTTVTGTVWTYGRIKQHLSHQPSFSLSLFRSNIQYGLKAYLAAFFAFLVLRVDMFMVKYMIDAEQAGYYSIAVNMADMVYMLPVVTATILFPKLSSMSDKNEKWNLSKKVILGSGFLLAVIAGLSTIFSKSIVQLLFGKIYAPAVPAFIWLMPGIFFMGIQAITVQFLNSEGFPRIIVWIWISAFLINVGLNIYAIPRYGIIGASIVSSISYFIVFLFVLLIVKKAIHE